MKEAIAQRQGICSRLSARSRWKSKIFSMVKEAVEAGADIIMLDNMDHDTMAQAMAIIDGKAEVEVSGNMTEENLAKLSGLGVDYVSSGALTHSAPIMDISLKNLHPIGA